MEKLEVDAALGGHWEDLGKLIEQSGQEDSSGLRRMLYEFLLEGDWLAFGRVIPSINQLQFQTLRQRFGLRT